MSQLDDLEIHRAESQEQESRPPPPSRLVLWAGVFLATAAVAVVVWLGLRRDDSARQASPTAKGEAAASERADARRDLGPVVEPIDLPPLDLTDPVVRDLLRRLSSHPQLAAWLASNNLIRTAVVSIDNVAVGKTPSGHLPELKPSKRFAAAGGRETLTIDPGSYSRYDGLADTAASMNAADLAKVYSLLKPRMQDAYRELGHPDGDIDAAVERAIVHLLQTPVVGGEIELEQRTVAYTFRDPALERLSPAQKQLLRMGPRNVRLVQAQLRAIAGELGIPEDRLPATPE